MTTTDISKIIERVRKLLALAGSANEHEAAVAAEKAQAILAEHNLSMSEIATDEKPDEEIQIDSEIETESRPWMRGMAVAVAKMYFCKHFYAFKYNYTTSRKCGYIRKDTQNFVGAPHNVMIAKMMFVYLIETVDRLARESARKYPVRERSSYITSFRVACAARLTQRIYERIAAARAGQVKTETGKNLPVLADLYDQTDRNLRAFLAEAVPSLRTSKARMTQSHLGGARDGRAAGDKIGLDSQVGGGKKPSHLIGK